MLRLIVPSTFLAFTILLFLTTTIDQNLAGKEPNVDNRLDLNSLPFSLNSFQEILSTANLPRTQTSVMTYAQMQANQAPQIVTGSMEFTKLVFHDQVDDVHAVLAADFNGDGLLDAIATDYQDDTVFWYENDGAGGFIPRVLDSNLDGAYPAHVGDVDGDGDADALAGGYLGDTFAWYESDGTGGFTKHIIDSAADGAHSIVTADLDQDGDTDLVNTNQDGNQVGWYENDGNENFTRHIIDSTATGAKRAEVADIDGDGDIDIFGASYHNDEIFWLENDGNENFTKQVMSMTADGAYYVSPADIDGDGDMDVFTASRLDATAAWYENDGNESFTFHALSTNRLGARSIFAMDIDKDGDIDAVGNALNQHQVSLYTNDGNGNFTMRIIDNAAQGAYGVFAIDMDKDGDMDLLSASRISYEVALYTQFQAHTESLNIGETLVIDTAKLQTIDPEQGPQLLTYSLKVAPTRGILRLNGTPLSINDTFTQDDIDNSRVTYLHTAANNTDDSFEFSVSDGGGNGITPAMGTFDLEINGSGGPTDTPTPTPTPPPGSTPTPTPPPGSGGNGSFLYVSSTSNGNVAGIDFDNEDVLAYDLDNNQWYMVFDGSDIGISSNLNGLTILDDDSLLLSFVDAISLPGIFSTVDDSDIVRFNPTSLGANTAGTFELYFDGSDVGLSSTAEDIYGLHVLSNGKIIISTNGVVSVPGVVASDEDLLSFTPSSLMANTAGTWQIYFDGSDVQLESDGEDIWGVEIDETSNEIHFSTFGSFAVTGVNGPNSDVLTCQGNTPGSTTTCSYSRFWDSSMHSFGSENVDALALHDSLLGVPVQPSIPGTSTLLGPIGVVGSMGLTFRWSEATDATDYTLVIYELQGDTILFINTYSATAICANNECSVQPGITFTPGSFRWLVQAENNGVKGDWSTYTGP
ncbi:MAG: FG-GAP-like repeat-containing protein [Chloroflexota bacterium]